MTNTISAFVGPVGTSTLIENIKKAESPLELRTVFDDWYDVIVSSRDDRRDAETLRAKLLEVIRSHTVASSAAQAGRKYQDTGRGHATMR